MSRSTAHRTLAIAPSTRGFGFVIMDRGKKLVDWGLRTVKGADKNAQSFRKFERLLAKYQPHILVMPNHTGTRRAERIMTLSETLNHVARERKIKVARISRMQVMRLLGLEARATKHAAARVIAEMFPDELREQLPNKRQPWMSENANMDLFEAVALALAWDRKRPSQAPQAPSN
jgi:hypothetical protein